MPRLLSPEGKPLVFRFNGRPYRAYAGESIAAALVAANQFHFVRSLKYHRPRGPFCFEGSCEGCLVRVDGEPSVPACQTLATEGQVVESQNCYPTLEFDFAAAADWFFPEGLDHHTLLTRFSWLNELGKKGVRRLAGLGLPPAPHVGSTPIERLVREVDFLIIGAGPAGLGVGRALHDAGREVLLVDGRSRPGGSWLVHPDGDTTARWVSRGLPLSLLTRVVAYYPEEDAYVAMAPGRSMLVRARTVVHATGAYSQPLTCPGGDEPRVVSARAAQLLYQRHGIALGDVVAAPDGRDWPWAKQVLRYTHVAAIEAMDNGLRVHADDRTFDCDVVIAEDDYAAASELARLHGCLVRDTDTGFVIDIDGGQTSVDNVFACGDVTGFVGTDIAHAQGLALGAALATDSRPNMPVVQLGRNTSGTLYKHPRAFVCRCEDVSGKDIANAVANGHSDIEEIKRYTGFGTGPCQGKSCTKAVAAFVREKTGEPAQPFTSRPPANQTSFAHFAAFAGHAIAQPQASPREAEPVVPGADSEIADGS